VKKQKTNRSTVPYIISTLFICYTCF